MAMRNAMKVAWMGFAMQNSKTTSAKGLCVRVPSPIHTLRLKAGR